MRSVHSKIICVALLITGFLSAAEIHCPYSKIAGEQFSRGFFPISELVPSLNAGVERAFGRLRQELSDRRVSGQAKLSKQEIKKRFVDLVNEEVSDPLHRGARVFDTPVGLQIKLRDGSSILLPKALAKELNIDHHGRFFDAANPQINTTMQVLDVVESVIKRSGGDVEKATSELKRTIGAMTTDNLGDGAWSVWIGTHLEEVAKNPELRDLIRKATYFEDFGAFGTAFEANNKDPKSLQAIELQKAILRGYDLLLASKGIVASDRFDRLPSEAQRELMDQALKHIDLVLSDSSSRQSFAKEFDQMREQAALDTEAAHKSMELRTLERLKSIGTPEEKAVQMLKALSEVAYVFDGKMIDPKKYGTFGAWTGPPKASQSALQLNVTQLPNGRTSFLLYIVNGRQPPEGIASLKPIGATIQNAALVKVIRSFEGKEVDSAQIDAAVSTESKSFNGGRDALQFSFEGVGLSPEGVVISVYAALSKAGVIDGPKLEPLVPGK